MNTQPMLDWRLVHGSRYRYADLECATGLSRRTLYKQRNHTRFGRNGLFTYGEALALLFAHRAHVVIRIHTTVLQDLAAKLDHATVDDTTVCVSRHGDGRWTAHVGSGDTPLDGVVCVSACLPDLAIALANAHARMHTQTQ